MKATLAAVLLLTCTACESAPAKSKAPAQATARETLAVPALPARAGSTLYSFDQERSSIEFVGAKLTRKHAGKFAAFRGTLQLVGRDVTSGAVSIVVDTASLGADDERLTRHLKSPDFLHVERFPKATFTSSAIQAGGPDGTTHTVTGNLELHGVTKQLTFPAKIRVLAEAVEVTAELSILREDFGITYDGVAGDLIKNDVLLLIKLDARKG
jgi:polyisoprenoid-binding protein YceI